MAAQTICKPKVVTAFGPSTAEDAFSLFGQVAPGADVWIGNGTAANSALSAIRRTTFRIDAIPTRVAFRATLAEQELVA